MMKDLHGTHFSWVSCLIAGRAFDTTQPVNNAVSNIICSVVYGNRFEYDDHEFTTMGKRANENTRLLGSPAMQVLFYIPYALFEFSKLLKCLIMASKTTITSSSCTIGELCGSWTFWRCDKASE